MIVFELLLSAIIEIVIVVIIINYWKELKFYENRYSNMVRGNIVDYRKRKHSLNADKNKRVLYHPIVKYKYYGNTYQSMSDVGYDKEYYKVGTKVKVSLDELNPERIKLEGEVKYERKIISLMVLLAVIILWQVFTIIV